MIKQLTVGLVGLLLAGCSQSSTTSPTPAAQSQAPVEIVPTIAPVTTATPALPSAPSEPASPTTPAVAPVTPAATPAVATPAPAAPSADPATPAAPPVAPATPAAPAVPPATPIMLFEWNEDGKTYVFRSLDDMQSFQNGKPQAKVVERTDLTASQKPVVIEASDEAEVEQMVKAYQKQHPLPK